MKDIQKEASKIPIPIQKVGVKNIQLPISLFDKDKDIQNTIADIDLAVDLPASRRGTHMSRFIEIISKYTSVVFDIADTEKFMEEIREKLDSEKAYFSLKAPYFIRKISPVSKIASLLPINITITASLDNTYTEKISVKVPITTLCPCSKEISEHGAHNQRSHVEIELISDKMIWFEDLVEIIEKNASSPIYPLLKREDEKAVTEQAYNNPVFVEDIVRHIADDLSKIDTIRWFKVTSTNQESIHAHDAYAVIEK